jgi:hypothetical protein
VDILTLVRLIGLRPISPVGRISPGAITAIGLVIAVLRITAIGLLRMIGGGRSRIVVHDDGCIIFDLAWYF